MGFGLLSALIYIPDSISQKPTAFWCSHSLKMSRGNSLLFKSDCLSLNNRWTCLHNLHKISVKETLGSNVWITTSDEIYQWNDKILSKVSFISCLLDYTSWPSTPYFLKTSWYFVVVLFARSPLSIVSLAQSRQYRKVIFSFIVNWFTKGIKWKCLSVGTSKSNINAKALE